MNGEFFSGFKEKRFLLLLVGGVDDDDNGDKERSWRCGGVYGFYFLCCFLLCGMIELEWMLLDTD